MNTADQSHITFNQKGEATAFVGADAVSLYRAALLSSSIKLFAKSGIMPTRGVTGPKMLKLATGITGKTYKRGQYDAAAADLDAWAKEMKAALPHETK